MTHAQRMGGIALLVLSLSAANTARAADKVAVAATIAPIHSLVSMVTGDVTEPTLIVRPGSSPHDYAMRPSEAEALDDADLVFWVGEGLETWMSQAIGTLAADAVVIELEAAEGITPLALRQGGDWADHDHDHAGHDHDDGDDHNDGAHGDDLTDPHLWLDPVHADIWLGAIADALIEVDPSHEDAYRANAEAARAMVEVMTAELESMLTPIKTEPYVVFHDAYQYFEKRFDLGAVGSVSLGDADRPGPARLVEIKETLAAEGVACIFAEPQFEPKLIDTVIEGSDVKKGILDPIGAGLEPGAELYPMLMRGLAASLVDCLGPS